MYVAVILGVVCVLFSSSSSAQTNNLSSQEKNLLIRLAATVVDKHGRDITSQDYWTGVPDGEVPVGVQRAEDNGVAAYRVFQAAQPALILPAPTSGQAVAEDPGPVAIPDDVEIPDEGVLPDIQNDKLLDDELALPPGPTTVRPSLSARNRLWISRNSDGTLFVKTGDQERSNKTLKESPLTSSVELLVSDGSTTRGLTTERALTPADFDPFSVEINWNWNSVSVGDAVDRIARFIGYSLIIRDSNISTVYSMFLPASHRVVTGVNARIALEMLGGPAYTVVVDHTDRTVMHRLKPMYSTSNISGLPRCPEDLTFAVKSGEAWRTEGGVSCVIDGGLDR